MKKNASIHAYSTNLDPALVAEQLKTNQELLTEVDEFKNSEAASKVTSLYDKRCAELIAIMEPKKGETVSSNDKLVNVYCNLYGTAELRDLAKRLLLDQCFFEAQGVRRQSAERVSGVLMKIDEKTQNRPTYPQKGGNWLSEED